MPDDHDDDRQPALSAVPAAGGRRGMAPNGAVKFFYGPMDCGKSTLALQLDYNHSRQGRRGLLLTRWDRVSSGRISSRMGIGRPAVEVADDLDIADLVRQSWAAGRRVDYLIVDEVQFFTPLQIEQLAQLADDAQVDVYAFGIATDFRGRLFPASARLFELADEILPLQVEVLCWCGRPGRMNGRVVDGVLAREGATMVVADTVPTGDLAPSDSLSGGPAGDPSDDPSIDGAGDPPAQVHYQVLCRAHHRSGNLGPGSNDRALPWPREGAQNGAEDRAENGAGGGENGENGRTVGHVAAPTAASVHPAVPDHGAAEATERSQVVTYSH